MSYVKKLPEPPPGCKWCHECQSFKPVSEFHRDGARYDGLASECKACKLAYVSARKAARRAS